MKVIVIGGGAAGFFAAIHAAQYSDVVLLEKSNKLLAKVMVSGGGRCNVANSCIDPELLVRNYPRGGKELRGPFSRFHTQHTIDWFESRGVKLKTEHDGRMFPVTDNSQTIIDCLLKEASLARVEIRTGIMVKNIAKEGSVFHIETPLETFIADKVIIATGGSPSGDGYSWLKQMGHHIVEPVPSLFTFNMPGSPFLELMGVSLPYVQVKIVGSRFTQQGPLLFTHWGLSGPAVLKLSAWAARWLHEQNYNFSVVINFFPNFREQELRKLLQELLEINSGKIIISSRPLEIPARLWEKLCIYSGIDQQKKWAEIGKTNFNKLIENLSRLTLSVKGKTTFKEEFVTCGGILLKEVNMQNMESKIVPGLFFAGEVLDIDGVTGGFNFQAAWTTGFLAGQNKL